MRIVWDEPKRLANIDKHGLDFRQLDDTFFEDCVVVPVNQGRLAAIGLLAGQAVTTAFAMLGTEAISIISMRPASRRERRLLP